MLRKDILTPFSLDRSSASDEEIARFTRLAEEWWKPDGAFKLVHRFNEARLSYLMRLLPQLFAGRLDGRPPLVGLSIIDVGCGAGLVAEPLAQAGARVTGIDPSARNIEIAKAHQVKSGAQVHYRHMLPETLAETDACFDVVLALEVVEHVADVPLFLDSCARFVAPGGVLVLATLNRTVRSFLFAIIGAEYVLRLLPRGTHDWRKFIAPSKLEEELKRHGLTELERTGMRFNSLRRSFGFTDDLSVNFLQVFQRANGDMAP